MGESALRLALTNLDASVVHICVLMILLVAKMKKKLLVRGGMTGGGHRRLDTRIIPPLPA